MNDMTKKRYKPGQKTRRDNLFGAFAFTLFLLSAQQVNSDPLQGRVEDSQADGTATKAKQIQDDLEAQLDQVEKMKDGKKDTALKSGVQETGQKRILGTIDEEYTPFDLGAANDPDATDRELQIDWDRWRNTLTNAIQTNLINNINVQNDANYVFDPRRNMMVSRYPIGISAQYSCDVLPNNQIINVRITQTSGSRDYDQCVFQAIMSFQGNKILRYPKRSKRQIVNQQASIRTSTTTNFQDFKYGDVERQRQPQ